MSRKCEHCYWEITTKYILKQKDYERIICPNCGRTLKATKISKLLYRYIEILGVVGILLLPINLKTKLFIEGVWIGSSVLFVPAMIYSYEKLYKDTEI
ncbi:MAG: hypothetical protein ACRC2K_09660 [Clostridium sp.]